MVAEPASLPDEVRAACAWVAARAGSVRIEEGTIAEYAQDLPVAGEPGDGDPEAQLLDADPEARAAHAICLNAINFGSGWWPTIRKRPGLSGYGTVAAGVEERFCNAGAWTATELTRVQPADIATVLRQDPGHPLMEQFAAALRDVGRRVRDEHGGRFEAVVDSASGSAVALASGLASFPDRDRLTAFADNLVPHVLRVDGVLRLDPELKDAIEAGELLVHGSPEEVELRACAVQAVELLAAATGERLSPAAIDAALWNRGREPRYKAITRPRSRNTAY
jgi:hypothetical protein